MVEEEAEEETSHPVHQIKYTVRVPQLHSLIIEMGAFLHASEGDMLYESTNSKIPYFNAPIFLENKVFPSSPPPPFPWTVC